MCPNQQFRGYIREGIRREKGISDEVAVSGKGEDWVRREILL